MKNLTQPEITKSGAEKINEIFDSFSFEKIIDDIVSGKFSPSAGGVFNRIIHLFLGELKSSFALTGTLAALVLICAMINNIQESFGRKGVGEAARFSLFIYLTTIAVSAFNIACEYVYETLSDITVLMQGIIPSMAMLCISGGGGVMGTMAHPVIFFVCSAMTMLIRTVITPLVLLRGATALLCGISQNSGMNEFSGLFSKIHRTLLALSMTLFAGLLGLCRFAATSFDSLAARGIKFAISSTVPIVGGSISEAMSSVAGSALLLKNAVGITGVLMLFAIFVVPMIKLGALAFAYRITAAIASPVSDTRLVTALRTIGECIDMLFASVACMGIIMVIAIASIL